MMRRLSLIGGFTLAATIVACGSYERTNPLDPAFPLSLTIVGPDTIYSLEETVQYQATTEAANFPLSLVWTSTDLNRLQPAESGAGRFTSRGNGTVRVQVEAGPHVAEKEVVIEQKAVRLRIVPPPSSELTSFGEVLNLSAAVVDARDVPIQSASGGLEWISSDSLVATVAGGRVTARGNGSTWVRASALDFQDSLRVQVRQVPVTFRFASASYTIPIPGGSVQTVLQVQDARGNAIATPEGLTLTSSRSSFQVSSSGVVQSTGFGSAVITARLGQLEATTAVRVVGGTAPVTTAVNAVLTGFPGGSRNVLLVELDARDAESDLDQATVEIYSAASTWMATRVIPLEQGSADYSTLLVFTDASGAGTARVRLRDAAQNNSSQTIWNVISPPVASAPTASIDAVARSGNRYDATVTVAAGANPLRSTHLLALNGAGEVVASATRGADEGPHVLSVTVPAGTEVSAIGVAVTDTAGAASQVRTMSVASASSGSLPQSLGATNVHGFSEP